MMSADLVGRRNYEASDHFNGWPNDFGFEVDRECREPLELQVFGSIPEYCAGVLYRIGPGKYKIEREDCQPATASHWFDGFSQLHKFQILPRSEPKRSTRVFYNSRYTVDSLIENVRKTGDMEVFTFGQKRDPCQSFFKKVTSIFRPIRGLEHGKPDSHNIGVALSVNMPGLVSPPRNNNNVYNMDSPSDIVSLISSTDANGHKFLDPETLAPIGLTSQAALHPDLKGPLCATHSQTDPLTGDVFNYNLDIGYTSTYRVFCASASSGLTTIIASITDAPPAYLHSFFLTANHVILCVWGSHFAMYGLKTLYTRNIIDALDPLDPSQPCRWYVIDRSPQRRGLVAKFTSAAFYAFHTINAYEEKSTTRSGEVDIVADVACYDDLSVLKRFYYENLKSSSKAALKYTGDKATSSRFWIGRFRLPNVPTLTSDTESAPLEVGSREAVQVWKAARSESVELPTLNPQYMTKKHRYVYGITDRGASTFFDGLGKFDCETQTSLFWSEKGQTPSEPIFIPDPDGSKGEEEDAGMLLTVVLDGYQYKSYLLVLDARTMLEVGRADVGHGVAFGFHGLHVPRHR